MNIDSIPLLGTAKRAVCACVPCGNTRIGSYTVRVGKQFAEGGFSTVFRCTDAKTGEAYALKRMLASEDSQIRNIAREIEMHQRFPHPHLLRLLDYSAEEQPSGQMVYKLLFPLYEAGSVGDVIARMRSVGKIFSETHALRLFAQVLSGVAVMHAATPPVAHHDIKPENILLSGSNTAVLMDFGSACRVRRRSHPWRVREVAQ
jgi:serine/threonine protein kinase